MNEGGKGILWTAINRGILWLGETVTGTIEKLGRFFGGLTNWHKIAGPKIYAILKIKQRASSFKARVQVNKPHIQAETNIQKRVRIEILGKVQMLNTDENDIMYIMATTLKAPGLLLE